MRLVFVLLFALFFTACAKLNDSVMRALASPVNTLAIVNDRLLSGDAFIYADRTGTLDLSTDDEPLLQCRGALHYTATRVGRVDLRCNDGVTMTLPFTAIGDASAHAQATAEGGSTTSLTWGVPPDQVRPYLKTPPGKRLVLDEETLRLE